MPELILASASPRRHELLRQIGVDCRVAPVNIPEVPKSGETPYQFVERLALEKARAGFERSDDDSVVLGADTVVVHDGHIMGKPVNKADAIRMLQRLSASEHEVLTAIAVVGREQSCSQVVSTRVRFIELDRTMCERYWDTGEPQDKAGSYGIQGLGAVFVTSIEGSYTSVVGLPLMETAALLVQFDIDVWQ
ncbi:MAG: Maf family protein [Amphritea sp.]